MQASLPNPRHPADRPKVLAEIRPAWQTDKPLGIIGSMVKIDKVLKGIVGHVRQGASRLVDNGLDPYIDGR